MSLSPSLLLFDGLPELPLSCPAARADGPLDAAKAIAQVKPQVVVMSGAVGWQRAFVASLPPEHRPAVLAVGGRVDAALADEWMSNVADGAELESRIALARQRARLRRQVARRAFVDFLTGLPNRRASVRALIREAARARRTGGALSLVLIDLDDFKAVNEERGHPAGDRLLRRVGARLREVTRENELCGRIGGDEFALVIAGDLSLANKAARRVKAALADIGVSATTAACELGSDERLRDLYRRTDRLLKAAKERRRVQRRLPLREQTHAIAS